MTALILGSTTSPPVYLTSAINSATVTVNDNDVAAVTFSAGAGEVAEGGTVPLTITAAHLGQPDRARRHLRGKARRQQDDPRLTEQVGVELTTGVFLELFAGFILRHGDAGDSGQVFGVALGQGLRGEATREGRVLDRLHLHRVRRRAALELGDHEAPVIVQPQ